MNEPVIVPDASVLLKWSLNSADEKDREKALAIRSSWISGRCRIILPTLWLYEVGNILGRLKQADLARELLEIYVGYRFEEEGAADLYELILEIMKEHAVTFYDAAYHSVAIKHRGTYVSADDKYVRQTLSLGHVASLEDWTAE